MTVRFSWPLLLTLAACSSGNDARPGEEPTPTTLQPRSLPECPDFDYTPCDIREQACQEKLRALAACVYERDPASDVAIDVMTEADYEQIILEDLGDEPDLELSHFLRALSVLSLSLTEYSSKADYAKARVEWLNGVYRWAEKRIVIIDHDRAVDDAYTDAVLVHELVHSMQDADYDLMTWPQGIDDSTFDAFLATNSVVEGEATYYLYRVGAPLLGLDVSSLDFRKTIASELIQRQGEALFSMTPYSSSFSSFPYGFGAAQAYEAVRARGRPGLEELWASPPTTTQQVMCRLYGCNAEQAASVEIPEPIVTEMTLDSQEVLGAWGIRTFLFVNDFDQEESLEHGLAWRGDHFWVYTDATGTVSYGLWQLELATAADAQALDDALAQVVGASGEHETAGTRVFVTFAYDGQAASPELTAWGRAWLAE